MKFESEADASGFAKAIEYTPGWMCDTCRVGSFAKTGQEATAEYWQHQREPSHIEAIRVLGAK